MINNREQRIIAFIERRGACSSKEIFESAGLTMSYATLKRVLAKLLLNNYIITQGQGKGTKYLISAIYNIIKPVDIEKYYKEEIDQRKIKVSFDFEVINDVLSNNDLFKEEELLKLNALQELFKKNISQLSTYEYKNEFERLAIDLSWKSSQIEGNTYSLLETEKLLKDKETAAGKTKEEAIMLLNHKEAMDFILDNQDYINDVSVSKIVDIHSILVKELNIEKNLRKRRVGISGTNYRPLDNEFQIAEALEKTCSIINCKKTVFEKALLSLALISYIQPFVDGNKRTARIVSNAVLISEGHCPLSFRTVDSIDYKKAMLLFYEQNNISAVKEIFIKQYEFAVSTYF